jgi:hypothetical protein
MEFIIGTPWFGQWFRQKHYVVGTQEEEAPSSLAR